MERGEKREGTQWYPTKERRARTTEAGGRKFQRAWEHFKDYGQVEFEDRQGKIPGFREVASWFFN